ncbi:MAG: glycosyltransferase family 4 protein, partial [Anaerolineales bacterium]|nr:glycosyltransferase family 4 protein [Anaerolineales bacterium]
GVETVLRERLDTLHEMGVEAFAWFLGDYGGREIFDGLENRIYIGLDALSLSQMSEFDVISSIDTPEIIPHLRGLPPSTIVIFEAHSPYFENLEYLRSREFRNLNIQRILVPSQYQKQVVMRFGISGEIVGVIPNPLGRQFFSASQEVPKNKKPIILWVGRFDHLKNWKGFLDLVKAMKARAITCEAIMIGDSNDRLQIAQEVYREIKKRSISDMIRWFSSLPYENIARMYDLVRESVGIVISTSRNESFCLSVVEAMARGCVVLAPNEGPFPEYLVSGSNGFLYDRHDLNKTVTLIQSVLENQELQDQINVRAKADMARLFHPDEAGKKLYSELQEIQ